MEVYFLRHGETEWNRQMRIQGSTEWTDLTESGVRLAEETRDGLLSSGVVFDRIYSSPYRRALHTANIIASGFGIEPRIDRRVREISFGPYEGTVMREGSFADSNIRACFMKPSAYIARDGAESFDDVAERVREFFNAELAAYEGKLNRVLVVSHGGILRTVLRLATGRPIDDYWKGAQPNCCAHIVCFSDGRITLKARAKTFVGNVA